MIFSPGWRSKMPENDQAPHRDRRLVRPAERPPHVELRARLARVVGEGGRARRMHPDRQIALGHSIEDRAVLRRVERPPRDVRVDLDTGRAEVVDRAVDLANRGVGIVHRQRGDEPGKALGVSGDDLGHPVVGQLGQLGAHGRAAGDLDRRVRQGQHLHVALVAVHDPQAQLDVDQDRDPRHPLLERHPGGRDLQHPVEVPAGHDVGKDIDLHLAQGRLALRRMRISSRGPERKKQGRVWGHDIGTGPGRLQSVRVHRRHPHARHAIPAYSGRHGQRVDLPVPGALPARRRRRARSRRAPRRRWALAGVHRRGAAARARGRRRDHDQLWLPREVPARAGRVGPRARVHLEPAAGPARSPLARAGTPGRHHDRQRGGADAGALRRRGHRRHSDRRRGDGDREGVHPA